MYNCARISYNSFYRLKGAQLACFMFYLKASACLTFNWHQADQPAAAAQGVQAAANARNGLMDTSAWTHWDLEIKERACLETKERACLETTKTSIRWSKRTSMPRNKRRSCWSDLWNNFYDQMYDHLSNSSSNSLFTLRLRCWAVYEPQAL